MVEGDATPTDDPSQGSSDGSTPAKSFTVVLPSYHRIPLLAGTLSAYLSQEPDEVVVVLDGPHPEFQPSEPPFDDHRVRIAELPENRGLALARIAGLKAASGDIVLLADDDVVPCNGLLAGHRRHHAERRGLVVVGYMPVRESERRRAGDGHTLAYGRSYESVVAGWEQDPTSVLTSIWGGNISIDADLYHRVEAFKASVPLPYYEDFDLGIRCDRVGATGIFDRALRAEHRHRVSFEGRLRQVQSQGQAARMLAERWRGLPAGFGAWYEAPWRKFCWRITGWIPRTAVHRVYKLGYLILGYLHLWAAQDKLIDITDGWLVFGAYESTLTRGEQPR